MPASLPRAVVAGIGHCLPDTVVTSKDIEQRITDASDGFVMPAGVIPMVSGVKERRYADDGVASSDLAAAAATDALDKAGVLPRSVDMLIFASASHDVQEPATSNMVQAKTGCTDAWVVDVKNACNSFLNGLDMAAMAIATGRARRVLVTAGEVLHQTVNWQVRDFDDLKYKAAAFTLGDAGAAMLLEAAEDTDRGLEPASFISDGRQWQLSTVLAGGSLLGHDLVDDAQFFQCDSLALQELALSTLPDLVRKQIERVGWDLDSVDLCVPHQVSKGVITKLAQLADFPVEKCMITLDRFGNCAAASIPLALSVAADEGRLHRGDRVALVCGAAGFTAGVLPLVW